MIFIVSRLSREEWAGVLRIPWQKEDMKVLLALKKKNGIPVAEMKRVTGREFLDTDLRRINLVFLNLGKAVRLKERPKKGTGWGASTIQLCKSIGT